MTHTARTPASGRHAARRTVAVSGQEVDRSICYVPSGSPSPAPRVDPHLRHLTGRRLHEQPRQLRRQVIQRREGSRYAGAHVRQRKAWQDHHRSILPNAEMTLPRFTPHDSRQTAALSRKEHERPFSDGEDRRVRYQHAGVANGAARNAKADETPPAAAKAAIRPERDCREDLASIGRVRGTHVENFAGHDRVGLLHQFLERRPGVGVAKPFRRPNRVLLPGGRDATPESHPGREDGYRKIRNPRDAEASP